MRPIADGDVFGRRVEVIGKRGQREVGESKASAIAAAAVRSLDPGILPSVTTDFLVTTESRQPIATPSGAVAGYWCDHGVISVDHHVPGPEAMQHRSSANMALDWVNAWGPVPARWPRIRVSHCDADSVLAAGILSGALSPHARFGKAAIAADHTGRENGIADLLQSLQHWDVGRIYESFYYLSLLLKKGGEKNLPLYAEAALSARRAQRQLVRQIVDSGTFVHKGAGVYLGILEKNIDGELMPVLLPEASVIVIAFRMLGPDGKQVWGVKTRTSLGFPLGTSLLAAGLPGWGGRGNAGATIRNGGTEDLDGFIEVLVRWMSRELAGS